MDHILQPPVGYVVAKASHLQNKGEQWQGEESLTRKSEGGISQVELSVCVCVCVCVCVSAHVHQENLAWSLLL